jgi:hypothetical protein
MKAAMGGLAFGQADVWFYTAGAVSAVVFAASHALGAQQDWPLAAAAAPAALAAAAYVAYLAMNALSGSRVGPDRSGEYRRTLVLAGACLVAAVAARAWAARAGMTHLEFGGALAVAAGLGFVAAGALNPAPHRHPRSTLWAVGFPLVAAGLAAPFCTETQALTLLGVLGAAIFALSAWALHVELRRQASEFSRGTD